MPPKLQKSSTAAKSKTQAAVGSSSKTPAALGRGKSVDKKQACRQPGGAAVLKKTPATSNNVSKGQGRTPQGTGTQNLKKPIWSKEDEMARRIQTIFRSYRSRKLLLKLRQRKQEYDDTIERLQREAYLQIVKMEQEKAAKERMREEEEQKKRRAEAGRYKRMLEAAFEGDNDEIKAILTEVKEAHSESSEEIVQRFQFKVIECFDPNKNTPLSEAAAGGHPATISLLLMQGANPNVKGQYGRTPLYRAAFAGHVEAVKVLLKSGADPRIYADDGAIPEQISSNQVEQIFQEWDIQETERLLIKCEEELTKRIENDKKLWRSEEILLESEIKEAEKEHTAKQKELAKAYEELNKRIYEHDKSDNAKPELTLTAIHDAEDLLEKCKLHAEASRQKLQKEKLKMRMKRKEFQPDLDIEMENEEATPDVVVNIREMDDVLLKDVGNKIAESNKWPLIIDFSRQCATFLKYRDTNYISAVSPKDMEPETIRMNLLGAIRFGKFAVLDLLDIENIWPAIVLKFNAVQPDLLPALISKEFMKEERYLKLIKPTDGEQYTVNQFLSARTHNFKFVILTQLPMPPPELVGNTYIIKVHTPEPAVF